MSRILLLFFALLVLSIGNAQGQTRQITGTVISSEDKQPLPGVNVYVKEFPNVGTTTGIDGNFKLANIPANAKTVVFRFIGFQSLEQPISSTVINVTLVPDNQRLEEVVVTAMGMKREKKALGYAAQDLKSEQLIVAGNSNFSTSLQGKISGVDIKPSSGMPGASTNLVIRGARSFTGDNTPLYVVDGMPIASSIDYSTLNGVTGANIANRAVDIDPYDIESINILKGQAAAALYGIRASNGVVVITTKSGKGLAKGKPVITYTNSTSWDVISRYPDIQKQYAQGVNGAYGPSSSFSWGPRLEDLPNDSGYGGNTKNEYTKLPNGTYDLTSYAGMYYVPQLAQYGDPKVSPWVKPQRHDNIRDFFKTGSTQTNSFNISQSMENASYSFGIGSSVQTGIIPSTSSDRYNAKGTAEIRLSKAWKTGFNANYVTSKIYKAPGGNDALLGSVYPSPIQYNLKGYPKNTLTDPYKQLNYRGASVFGNPYWGVENNVFAEQTDRFYGNAFLEYNPKINWGDNKNLVVRYQAGIDSYTTHYQDIFEFGTRNGEGSINNYGITKSVFNSLLTANFSWEISPLFELTAIVGNEFNDERRKAYDQSGISFNFGGWKNVENTKVLNSRDTKNRERTVGVFGNIALSYNKMLYVNITGRRDDVSTMPRGNRSFFYPSISTSWIITELEGLKGNKWLNFLKLRASYAQVGQAGQYFNDYYSKPSYDGGFWANSPINYPINGNNAFLRYTTIYDPNLKPQNTVSYETGFDLRMLNNIVTIEYTYSRQNVTNQIFPVPLAGSSGSRRRMMNGGEIFTNSHEVIFNFRLLSTKEFEWNLGGNFTKIDNYVKELAPGVESIFLGGYVTPQVRAGIGDKFPVIYGTQFDRDKNGRILVDENPKSSTYGLPMAGSPGVIGNSAPDFIVGGSTSLRWKSVSLNATISWQKGGQMYSGTNGLLNLYGISQQTADRTSTFIYPGFKKDGTANDIKRGGASDPNGAYALYNKSLGSIDEAYIYDMDFVKLREIALNYSVPQFIKGVNVNLSAFARNILLWTKLPNLDPESSQGNNNMGGYFERFSLPQTKSFGFSVNLVF